MKKRKIKSLYIHIPFCKNICPYCDFVKMIYNERFSKLYIDQLIEDLNKVREGFFNFETIYIGGGTPSILKYSDLERLLKNIYPLKAVDCEFTIEANPEDINENFLKLIKRYDVNRISIGIQSFNKNVLKDINRDYDLDYFSIIKKTKEYIQNINIDLIYGFKNQTIDDLKNDLENFIKLEINHISIYSLTVNKGTFFYNRNYLEQNEDDSRYFYDYIVDFLEKNDFNRYEISNFSKKNYESKHNLTYWKNENYLGLGVGASGYIDNKRYSNSPNLTKYLNGIRVFDKEILNSNSFKEYFLITNLRLKDGINLKEYKKIFKNDFLVEFKEEINCIDKKLLTINDEYFACSKEGFPVLNQILIKLIKKL